MTLSISNGVGDTGITNGGTGSTEGGDRTGLGVVEDANELDSAVDDDDDHNHHADENEDVGDAISNLRERVFAETCRLGVLNAAKECSDKDGEGV